MENCFFCYSDHEGFGFGADEHFGLYVQENLSKGSSHPCKTYANAILSNKNHFAIKDLEVRFWIISRFMDSLRLALITNNNLLFKSKRFQ
jgi:hypothetical protein